MPAGLPRVLLIGDNASLKMGGEASFPYFYFRLLRERAADVWLITHARVRDELLEIFPADLDRIRFVEETRLNVLLWKLGNLLPRKISEQTIGVLRHLLTQRQTRKLAKLVIREQAIEIVHEVTPISPKSPSLLYGLGVPVVAGPLCGGMDYPPAFQHRQGTVARLVEKFGRMTSHLVNRLAPGRLLTDSLIVAHSQTLEALPQGVRGVIYEGISDSGVDMSIWGDRGEGPGRPEDGTTRFAYLGRLVDWKGVDLLLDAFGLVADRTETARLEILGDGPDRLALEAQADRLGIRDRVDFVGWVTASDGATRLKAADVFILPSLRECGGAVLLEAMALGLPCIATRWGGPGHFIDDSTGIRVEPGSLQGFVAGLADAMLLLAGSPELRRSMGEAGRRRVTESPYNWDRKVDRVIEIYRETLERHAAATPGREHAATTMESA
jgi:glycosyltransferase involved in cell wall biosynthesis